MNTLNPSPNRKHKHQFYIEFSDGTKIQGDSIAETIYLTIQKIGASKVANFAQKTPLKRKGYPYVSKTEYNIPGNYPYLSIEDHYFIKTISADNWKRFLEALNEDLKIGIKVRYIKNND